MNRRKVMKITAGIFAGSGIGLYALSNVSKTKIEHNKKSSKFEYSGEGSAWKYEHLNPEASAELAYKHYSDGGCMYGIMQGIISQLAEKIGDPYQSFPVQMFKYGHGGVGGYGTICGTLNGAAALIGLFMPEKEIRDKMIADIFQWYETKSLPEFIPQNSQNEAVFPTSVSNSVLCHASNTKWCNESGFGIASKERKEKCRRMSGDVAKKVTIALNNIFSSEYMTVTDAGDAKNTCLSCHGNQGKVNNSSVQMDCTSCHSESIGHRAFSDIHYKLMKEN